MPPVILFFSYFGRRVGGESKPRPRRGIKADLNITGGPGGIRTHDLLLGRQPDTFKLVNKLSVTELALLIKMDKSYISRVKKGQKPPSPKLLLLPPFYEIITGIV